MKDLKPTLTSKTILTSIAMAVVGGLGLGNVIGPEVVEAVTVLGSFAVMLFRKRATARLG